MDTPLPRACPSPPFPFDLDRVSLLHQALRGWLEQMHLSRIIERSLGQDGRSDETALKAMRLAQGLLPRMEAMVLAGHGCDPRAAFTAEERGVLRLALLLEGDFHRREAGVSAEMLAELQREEAPEPAAGVP